MNIISPCRLVPDHLRASARYELRLAGGYEPRRGRFLIDDNDNLRFAVPLLADVGENVLRFCHVLIDKFRRLRWFAMIPTLWQAIPTMPQVVKKPQLQETTYSPSNRATGQSALGSDLVLGTPNNPPPVSPVIHDRTDQDLRRVLKLSIIKQIGQMLQRHVIHLLATIITQLWHNIHPPVGRIVETADIEVLVSYRKDTIRMSFLYAAFLTEPLQESPLREKRDG